MVQAVVGQTAAATYAPLSVSLRRCGWYCTSHESSRTNIVVIPCIRLKLVRADNVYNNDMFTQKWWWRLEERKQKNKSFFRWHRKKEQERKETWERGGGGGGWWWPMWCPHRHGNLKERVCPFPLGTVHHLPKNRNGRCLYGCFPCEHIPMPNTRTHPTSTSTPLWSVLID